MVRAARPRLSRGNDLTSDWQARDDTIAAARERFAAGENIEHGIRPGILLSWYRSRDQYHIDPHQSHAPAADEHYNHSLKGDWALAELSAVGTSLLADVDSLDGLLAITDGAGRILLTRGARGTLHQGEQNSLASWFTWSEGATGTNGMGTALHERDGVLVRGSEHWCEAFHNWSCASIPITDPATGQPLAALDVSSRQKPLPDDILPWLRQSVQKIQAELRQQTTQEAAALRTALEKTSHSSLQPLIAIDLGGAIIAANDKAESLLGEPATHLTIDFPELADIARRGAARAEHEHTWVGTAKFFHPPTDDLLPVTLHPVVSASNRVIGFLAALGESEGETLSLEPSSAKSPPRLAATRGNRIILLRPEQIKFAAADGNTVWLATDEGFLRARARGLESLEKQLGQQDFIRPHRHFVVNLNWVKEVNYGFRGQLSLVMDSSTRMQIPVSKRRAASIRRALNL